MRQGLLLLLLTVTGSALAAILPDFDIPAPVVADIGQRIDAAPDLGAVLARDPIAGLEQTLAGHARDIRGYTCTLAKRERLKGVLRPPEAMSVWFTESPHRVLLIWQTAPAGLAERALYAEGENGGQLLVRPANYMLRLAGNVVARDADGPDAKAAGRYPLTEFGIRKATERTVKAWRAARDRGALVVQYHGVRPISELDGRPCHVLTRKCDPPENDGVAHVEIGLDAATGLQVRSILTGVAGEAIGVYHWSDVQLNPTFAPDAFSRGRLVP